MLTSFLTVRGNQYRSAVRSSEYRGAIDSICSITSLIARGCLSGGYPYFTSRRLMDDLNFARTSSRTVQSVRTSRRMARLSLNINTVATQVSPMSRLITLVPLAGLS